MVSEKKYCAICGKGIDKKDSDRKCSWKKRKYCSRKCQTRAYDNSKREKRNKELLQKNESKTCLGCGKVIFRKDYWQRNRSKKYIITDVHWKIQKFCSKPCAAKYHQKRRYREDNKYRQKQKSYQSNLPKEIKRRYYENSKPRRKQYYQENKERILSKQRRYPSKYKKERYKILELYNNRCAICKFDKVLEIHHINGKNKKRNRWNLSIFEYIVLCPNHHAMYHRGLLSKDDLQRYQKK